MCVCSRACHERPAQPRRCQRPSSALSPVSYSAGPMGCSSVWRFGGGWWCSGRIRLAAWMGWMAWAKSHHSIARRWCSDGMPRCRWSRSRSCALIAPSIRFVVDAIWKAGESGVEVGEQVVTFGEFGQQSVGTPESFVGVPPAPSGTNPLRDSSPRGDLVSVGPFPGQVSVHGVPLVEGLEPLHRFVGSADARQAPRQRPQRPSGVSTGLGGQASPDVALDMGQAPLHQRVGPDLGNRDQEPATAVADHHLGRWDLVKERLPCHGLLPIAPLPRDDLPARRGDQAAPVRAQVDSVDLDLVVGLTSDRDARFDAPAPGGLATEVPSRAQAGRGLSGGAEEPPDERIEFRTVRDVGA